MRRQFAWAPSVRALALGLLVAGLAPGCQPEVGVPGAKGSAQAKVPEIRAARAIGLVMPGEGVQAASVYEQLFRHEAAQGGVLCETILSEPGREAEAVRDMARRGVSAMVVVPAADERESVGSAVAEVRGDGVPVLLMERDASTGEGAVPLIDFSPLDESADRLVAEAVKVAREEGYPEDVKAVLLINGPFDEVGRQKAAALHRALERAKVETLPDLTFEGFQKEARAVLDPALKEHPDLGIVLAIEDQGVLTAASLRDSLDPKERRIVYAGFANSADTVRMTSFGMSAAIVEHNLQRLARRAFDSATELAGGGTLPDRIVVETPVHLPEGQEREGYFPKLRPMTPGE